MPAANPPKSILKKSPTSSSKARSPEEARSIALQHAQALQIRKALELSVLLSVEALLDLPSSPPLQSSSATPEPSSRDIRCFKHHLRFFTQADYDDLILERNIVDRCGYTLCPHPRKKLQGRASKYALVDKGRKTQRFVEREQLERFCGDACARRALWVKMQLKTEPAWMRDEVAGALTVSETGETSGLDLKSQDPPDGPLDSDILLFDEAEKKRNDGESSDDGSKWSKSNENDMRQLVDELEGLGIASKQLLQGAKGEKKEVKGVKIEERKDRPDIVVTAPSLNDQDKSSTLAIEGYVPRHGQEGKEKKDETEGKEKEEAQSSWAESLI